MTQSVTNIRTASRYDAAALARLGARSDRVRAHALLAEEAGEIIAAIDLTSGKVFADSARSSSEVVQALRQRRCELLRQRRYELLRWGGVVVMRGLRWRRARPDNAPAIRAT
jgi:hypothetical protein